ncbi:MAG: hypothetical protein JW772_00965 [Candidatus Diapherotrites archaeon]|nr:hypothetical protein [Candidatus Diapherotrites archaeon]
MPPKVNRRKRERRKGKERRIPNNGKRMFYLEEPGRVIAGIDERKSERRRPTIKNFDEAVRKIIERHRVAHEKRNTKVAGTRAKQLVRRLDATIELGETLAGQQANSSEPNARQVKAHLERQVRWLREKRREYERMAY